jgi:hypothetical protein
MILCRAACSTSGDDFFERREVGRSGRCIRSSMWSSIRRVSVDVIEGEVSLDDRVRGVAELLLVASCITAQGGECLAVSMLPCWDSFPFACSMITRLGRSFWICLVICSERVTVWRCRIPPSRSRPARPRSSDRWAQGAGCVCPTHEVLTHKRASSYRNPKKFRFPVLWVVSGRTSHMSGQAHVVP